MRCHRVRKHLHAYHDAELSASVYEAIAGHLRACPACRQALARLEQLADLLHATPARPVPEGFADRVLSQARRRAAAPQSRARARWAAFEWWTSLSVPVRVAAAIVAALGLSAGVVMGWQTGRRFPSPPVAAISAPDDPIAVYNLDYLCGTPDGSLPDAYLTLVSLPPGRMTEDE